MLKELLKLPFICLFIISSFLLSQTKKETIYYIGHAYGSHSDFDSNLDKSVIDLIYKNKDLKIDEIVFGGDFIKNCNDKLELNNLFDKIKGENIKLVLGNHDVCETIINYVNLNQGDLNSYRILNGKILLLYLNTNIKNKNELNKLIEFTNQKIGIQSFKKILIFTHQAIFSKNDFYLRTNSRKYYDYGNLFYDYLMKKYINSKIDFYFFSGDIGAFNFTPYSFTDKNKNFNLYAVGIGNDYNKNGIKITLDNDILINFVNLEKLEIVNEIFYSKYLVQIYQLPKLILFNIKENLKLLFTIFFFISIMYLVLTYIKKRKKL